MNDLDQDGIWREDGTGAIIRRPGFFPKPRVPKLTLKFQLSSKNLLSKQCNVIFFRNPNELGKVGIKANMPQAEVESKRAPHASLKYWSAGSESSIKVTKQRSKKEMDSDNLTFEG